MLENEVCPSSLEERYPADFVHYSPRLRKNVFSPICLYCLGKKRAAKPFTFMDSRERRVVELHNARTRQLGLISDLTVEQWCSLLEQSQGYCTYCRMSIGKDHLCLDHILPVHLGGGTTLRNVTPACIPCNSSKKGKTLDEWHCAKSSSRRSPARATHSLAR